MRPSNNAKNGCVIGRQCLFFESSSHASPGARCFRLHSTQIAADAYISNHPLEAHLQHAVQCPPGAEPDETDDIRSGFHRSEHGSNQTPMSFSYKDASLPPQLLSTHLVLNPNRMFSTAVTIRPPASRTSWRNMNQREWIRG